MAVQESTENPLLEFMKQNGEKTSHWESDFIFLKKLWEPLMKILVYIFDQRDTQRPWNVCVYGTAFSGKTTFFDHFTDALRRFKDLDRFGIIKISCLTNTTLKGIYRGILDELNWSFTRQDSIQDLEVLVGIAVRKRGCKLIIIDEFNQLYNMEEGIRIKEVLKALRNIPNRTLRPLVVVGTMTTRTLIQLDPETSSRFRKEAFPCFECVNEDKDNQGDKFKFDIFRQAVNALDQNLKETTGIVSNFANNRSILNTLLNGSKGRMGALVKIYEETANIAISNGAKELNHSFLKEALTIFISNNLVSDEYGISKSI